jgi:hypothetical protein
MVLSCSIYDYNIISSLNFFYIIPIIYKSYYFVILLLNKILIYYYYSILLNYIMIENILLSFLYNTIQLLLLIIN